MSKLAIACFSTVIVLTGCGHAAPTAMTSTPSAVAAPSALAATPFPAPSPSPPAPQPANLECRLPVVSQAQGGVERGWITFPGGQYAHDTATLANPSSEHMPSYDWGVAAWVPVEQQYVSPDGSDYVVKIDSRSNLPTGFYLVDAKTRSQRLIQSADGPGGGIYWTILAYQGEGIYLGGLGAAGDAPTEVPGLWLLDPLAGHVRLIDRSHKWDVIGGGVIWTLASPPNYDTPVNRQHHSLTPTQCSIHGYTEWLYC